MQDTSFENWLRQVDAIIADRLFGLTHMDLPDTDTRGMYNTGDTPKEAADYIIQYTQEN